MTTVLRSGMPSDAAGPVAETVTPILTCANVVAANADTTNATPRDTCSFMMVIRRVTRLAAIADQVSLGNLDAGEFKSRSKDEIGVLTEALARMKISLVQAMKMLE